jgi:hypothetical protein
MLHAARYPRQTAAVEEATVTDQSQRGGQLDRERLEALRGDVTAHVMTLPTSERTKLLALIDATLARIDAELERIGDRPPA